MKTPKNIIQFIKYGIVGVSNTLVTLIIIFICKDIFNIDLFISNFIGYIAGLINSFIWNRAWVFKSNSKKIKTEVILFFTGFALCYSIQIISVKIIISSGVIPNSIMGFSSANLDENIATIIGMVIYTLLNFIYNKFITFYNRK